MFQNAKVMKFYYMFFRCYTIEILTLDQCWLEGGYRIIVTAKIKVEGIFNALMTRRSMLMLCPKNYLHTCIHTCFIPKGYYTYIYTYNYAYLNIHIHIYIHRHYINAYTHACMRKYLPPFDRRYVIMCVNSFTSNFQCFTMLCSECNGNMMSCLILIFTEYK